jgi:hypothetical protein
MAIDPLIQAPTGSFPTRDDIAKKYCPGAACAEIGVAFGGFARVILAQRPCVIYLIDPWLHQPDAIYPGDQANEPQTNFDNTFRHMKREFGPLSGVRLMRMFGFDAAQQIENDTLGFVFIDAVHTVPMVIADAVAWWPKLKKGGCMAFHDWNLGQMGPDCPALQVSEAMKTFLYLIHKNQMDIVTDEQQSAAVIK